MKFKVGDKVKLNPKYLNYPNFSKHQLEYLSKFKNEILTIAVATESNALGYSIEKILIAFNEYELIIANSSKRIN